jgi:hypothetical protein
MPAFHARIDLGLLLPTYTFEQRFLGAQTTLGVLFPVGKVDATLQGTISGTLGPFGFSKFGSRTDEVTAAGDVIPIIQMRWNEGVNNFMAYITGDLPVGGMTDQPGDHLGIGLRAGRRPRLHLPQPADRTRVLRCRRPHPSITSIHIPIIKTASTFTSTGGASQFLSKQLFVGAVGYVYNQLTGDSGSGDRVGPFESRVVGVGPQIGYIFPLGTYQGYVNLKGYGEFDAHDRPHGYNAWLTLSISPPAPTPPPSARQRTTMFTK